jgi:hypothetical protein
MTKITKIGRNIDSQIIQRKIAHNSNSQNAVKITDLSSNHRFLIDFHSLSKQVRNPKTNNYYYFERARGQYIVERNLTASQNQFDKIYPNKNKFDVTDFSLIYFIGLREIKPYVSVQSGTKRYEKELYPFLTGESKLLGDEYFKRSIGALILFKLFRTVYGQGKNSIGKIRKNVLAYGIGFIQNELLKNGEEIDFVTIWNSNNEDLSEEQLTTIKSYLKDVNDFILAAFDDGRVDEACKKEDTWKKFKTKFITSKTIFEVIPSIVKTKLKGDKEANAKLNGFLDLLNLINLEFKKPAEYIKLISVVENEVEKHTGDGNSRFGRNHLLKLREHFNPKQKTGAIIGVFPKTYDGYLLEITSSKGVTPTKKLQELHEYIEDLKRIIDCVKEDSNFETYKDNNEVY